METLVHNRNQYDHSNGRRKGYNGNTGFRDINCRAFQSGAGILPTSFKNCTNTVSKHSSMPSPSEDMKPSAKSRATPINIKPFNIEMLFDDDFSYSEKWAGPAYSYSPPPSSLPIPKFSATPKRTLSLELSSDSDSDIEMHTIVKSKSAPSSPTRESYRPSRDLFFSAENHATKTLRRILNLDIGDE